MTDLERELRESYSRGASAWATGPARVYRRLADALVAQAPMALTGALVLDLGAGTGVASAAAAEAGAHVVAADVALGMLLHERDSRPPSVCADAALLAFRDGTFDAVIGACVFNHVPDLDAALREAARVVVPGGPVVASTFSTRQHPAKAAVDAVLAEYEFVPPPWFATFKAMREPLTASAARLRDASKRVGLVEVVAHEIDVDLAGLDPSGLAAYRLGMAHVQDHLDAITPAARAALRRDAAAAAAPTLLTPMPLLVLVGRVPG